MASHPRRRSLLPLLFSSALLVVTGCSNSDTAPSPPLLPGAPFSQTDLRVGTGADVVLGRPLTVNYTGWMYDPVLPDNKGRQIDTSIGRAPIQFTLGVGQVIRGWDQGFTGMKVGGLRRLVIPPDLAYGTAGRDTIPPNATLVFEVELVSVP